MLISIIILIILIFINGVFSASELAFLSIDKFKLKEDANNGNVKAKRVVKILKDTSSFLSTIQVSITLAGFFASAIASDYFADYLINLFNITNNLMIIRPLFVIIITLILSYFTLVFGELVPKRIAINNPTKLAYSLSGVINVVNIIFYPIVKLLSNSTNFICKIFKIKEKNNTLTEEDIKKMIITGNDEGILEEREKDYILNVFEFNDISVSKVMTPIKEIVLLNIDDDIKDIISIIKESKYTRFPVYKGDINNIIGILNVKDLIISYSNDKDLDIHEIIRKVSSFKSNEKIDEIFKYMQENQESMCTVYEGKKLVGIVTVEDAIEEIVGNIYDEYD